MKLRSANTRVPTQSGNPTSVFHSHAQRFHLVRGIHNPDHYFKVVIWHGIGRSGRRGPRASFRYRTRFGGRWRRNHARKRIAFRYISRYSTMVVQGDLERFRQKSFVFHNSSFAPLPRKELPAGVSNSALRYSQSSAIAPISKASGFFGNASCTLAHSPHSLSYSYLTSVRSNPVGQNLSVSRGVTGLQLYVSARSFSGMQKTVPVSKPNYPSKLASTPLSEGITNKSSPVQKNQPQSAISRSVGCGSFSMQKTGSGSNHSVSSALFQKPGSSGRNEKPSLVAYANSRTSSSQPLSGVSLGKVFAPMGLAKNLFGTFAVVLHPGNLQGKFSVSKSLSDGYVHYEKKSSTFRLKQTAAAADVS